MDKILTQDVWIDVDKQLPENDTVVKILYVNNEEDISKFANGHFYIRDHEVLPITHWKTFKSIYHT